MADSKFFDAINKAVGDFADAAFGDSTFPDAAFIIETGAQKKSGKSLQKYRHLPHHSKSATSPTDNGSVDLPHLRIALARVGQVKTVKENAASYQKRAKAHLNAHARALLKTDKAEGEALCKELGINPEGEE